MKKIKHAKVMEIARQNYPLCNTATELAEMTALDLQQAGYSPYGANFDIDELIFECAVDVFMENEYQYE